MDSTNEAPRRIPIALSQTEVTLLVEVLRPARPELAALVPPDGRLLVGDATCMDMRETVLMALLARGFGGDDEPTEYGLRLEALIDRFLPS